MKEEMKEDAAFRHKYLITEIIGDINLDLFLMKVN